MDNFRKDEAVRQCRKLCCDRVVEEIKRRKGTSTAEHLKIVLSIIDGLEDEYRRSQQWARPAGGKASSIERFDHG